MKAILSALALSFAVAIASADDVLLISPMDLLFSGDTLLGKRVRVEGQRWFFADFMQAKSVIYNKRADISAIYIELGGLPIQEHRAFVEACSGNGYEVGPACDYTVEGSVAGIDGTGVTLKDVRLIPVK